MNAVDNNQTEFLGRLQSLERRLQAVSDVQQEQGEVLQGVIEVRDDTIEYGQQNHIRNGDLHFTRNNYLYDVDFAGGTGEDQNVSEEAAHIYSHPKDTSIDTIGTTGLAIGTFELTIDTPDFVVGDVGGEIIIYGVDAGDDLITTIATYVSPTQVTVTDAIATPSVDVRVRFRLLELKEDSTDENEDASLATNTALKTTDHTRYGSTVSDPDYDKDNGWVRWSDADNTLTFPLPYNILTPSKQYILTFIYKLDSEIDGEDSVFVDFYGGLWDNSVGRRQYLEGQIPSLTGSAQGTTGATSRDYMVLMYNSDGSTVATETLTIADTHATLDANNFVELTWSQEAGVVRSEIYRHTAGTYVRLLPPYPANTYYDKGQISNTVGGFPTATRERFIAKTQVTEANFPKARTGVWTRGQINIVVPSDYNASQTTGKQWLIIGMNTGFSGSGSDHALLVDLISLDDKYGVFTRCPLDFQAKRGVNTGPTSGNQGTTGGGGTEFPGGGGGCPVFTDLIETDQGEVRAIDLVDNESQYQIINRQGIAVDYEAQIIPPQTVYTLIAGDRKLTGSGTHPVFEGSLDNVGKPLSRFKESDIIDIKGKDTPVDCLVKHFKKRHTVKFTLKGPDHGFWQNGIAVHNEKPEN